MDKKFYTHLFSLLLFQFLFVFTLFGQNGDNLTVAELLALLKEPPTYICDTGTDTNRPDSEFNKLIKVLESSSSEKRDLLSIAIKERESNEILIPKIIYLAGMIASPEDEEIVAFLEKYAQYPRYYSYAMRAIFRIGGHHIISNVDSIISFSDYKGVFSNHVDILEELWLLDDLYDLKRAKIALEFTLILYPTKRICQYIEITLLPRVIKAIELMEHPKSKKSIEFIKELIDFKARKDFRNYNNEFKSVTGGVSFIWALKKVKNNFNRKEALAIFINFEKNMKENGYSNPGHTSEYVLYCKSKLGQKLTSQEIKWINSNGTTVYHFTPQIIRNGKELLDYYHWKEKIAKEGSSLF